MADGFRFDLIPPGSGVLCALSGGADSMYLLCRLLEGRERYGWTVCAAHLDHGLRESAGRDADFVRAWCEARGVPLSAGREDVAALARRLNGRDIRVELTEEARQFIARAGYSPSYGARPVKRYLQKHVETELAAMLIRGTLSDGQQVVIGSDGEKLTFRTA